MNIYLHINNNNNSLGMKILHHTYKDRSFVFRSSIYMEYGIQYIEVNTTYFYVLHKFNLTAQRI